MTETKIDRWFHGRWFLSAVAAATMFFVLTTIYFTFLTPDRFDPLRYFPADVTSTVFRTDGAAVRVGDPVLTSQVRCNESDHPVDVVGNVVWERLTEPTVRFETVAAAIATIPAGCETRSYENTMPVEVIEAAARGEAVWRITGTVTPEESGGVSATWETERFWIVP